MSNLLIVSDVHLSRLRPRMMVGGQAELHRFIEHFARHREGGTPWRLLLNGDLLDFDHHARTIAERGPERESLRIFREIAAEFAPVFAALARFLEAGNEVVVLPGNHDMDLQWPSVREALRAEVARSLSDPAALARLCFRDWFHFERDRIWVEHGHLYDCDTATSGMLAPFDPGPRLRSNLGMHWIADFCPHIPEIAYHVDHTRSTLYYVPVMVRHYGWKGPWMWLRYVVFALRTLRAAGRSGQTEPHLRRRAELAVESGIPEAVLASFDEAVEPRMVSRVATGARLHILPALLLPVVLVLGILGGVLSSWALGAAAIATAALALGVSTWVSSRFRGHVQERLRAQAELVQRALEVPIVSFGHDHLARDVPAGGGRYVNSGTWSDPRVPMSYVKVVGHEARLCAWDGPAPPG